MQTIKEALADQTMLAPKKLQTDLIRHFPKAELLPNCVTAGESLIEFYDKTDLEFTYVFGQCKILKPLKGIEITLQMVEFWYREFIRAGWNKKWFDKQLKAVKQKQLFNRIDIADWFSAEIMYTELDFNTRVERKINSMLQRGAYLKNNPEIELTEEDKKCIELEIAHELEFKRTNDLLDKKESYKQERKRLILGKYQ